MRISNPFRYQFRSSYPSSMSVYKLHFGKRFLIVMCKALHQSVNQMAKELDQRLRLGTKEGDIFAHVVPHIRRSRVTIMEVEAVCQPETELDLLKCHFKALKAAQANPACLNTSLEVKVPGWVAIETTEAFNVWVKTQTRKPKAKTKNHHRNESSKSKAGRQISKASNTKPVKASNVKAGTKGTGRGKAGVRAGKR